VAKLEEELAQTRRAASRPSPQMVDRLENLRQELSQELTRLRRAAALPPPELSRRVAELEQRLQEQGAAPAGGAPDGLESRVAALEKRLDQVRQEAGSPPPRVAKRLEELEERLSKLPPKPESQPVVHTVRRGQTLYGISRRYGVEVDDLRRWNPQVAGRPLWIGEELTVYPAY
jgi:LysM repeat protein